MKALAQLTALLAAVAWIALAQGKANDEAALRSIEQKWDTATLKGDAATLEGIFADGYIETGSSGTVRTKAEVIGAMRAGRIQYDAAKTDELRVILHGDAAVVSGRWQGSYKVDGRTVRLTERFTNFYVRRGGQWRCVASHGTSIQ